jgi:hypothetical protein
MATRQSMEEFFERCEEVIRNAEDQFIDANRQEHYNDNTYIEALQEIETIYNELTNLAHSANDQQREQLHRMRLQIQQLQNSMILLDH